jgi:hypothetical protein
MRQKSAPHFSGALFCCATNALINDFNKVRLARADHALGVGKAVHVNCEPVSVHEHEVRIPDQSEMARAVSLNEELFRMPLQLRRVKRVALADVARLVAAAEPADALFRAAVRK